MSDVSTETGFLPVSQDELRQRLRWALRALWRGKHLVLACLVLVLVPTVLFLQQATPRYTAEALLMITAAGARDAFNASEDHAALGSWLTDQQVQTEADLIGSAVLAGRVIDKLHLKDDVDFNGDKRETGLLQTLLEWSNPMAWIPAAPQTAAATIPLRVREQMESAALNRRFLSNVMVRVQRRSFIVSVRYTMENPEKAALIANALAEQYVLDRLEVSFDEARRVSEWLGDRLEGLRRDVVNAETAVEEYRSANNLRRKGEQSVTLADQQMSELNSRLVIARAELAQKQARLDQVRGLLNSHSSADTTSDVLQSPLIQRLREQESIRQGEMSDALKTYGDRHPRILGYRADLGELRSKIAREIEKIGASIANDVEIAAAGVRSLERELEKTRLHANVAGEAEIRLRELERQAEAARTVYSAFLTRFKREAETGQVQRANARIISPAEIPTAPSYPSKRSIIWMAFMVALASGVSLVFLLDRIDNAVRSSDEAELLTGVPTMAMIPLQKGRTGRLIDEVLLYPRSTLADAVRSLRTALDFSRDDQQQRVILVTSSVPKEGKTFVSLCLAVAFAKAGHRVLLIDCDLHRPSLHRVIETDGGQGLAQILAGETSLEQVVQHRDQEGLDFLPAGTAPNLAELIKGEQMAALIAEYTRHYDRIVIDSPPVLAITDTRILARLVDRVLFLIRWNQTPRDAVRNAMKLLHSVGVTPYGVALSQVNQRKHMRYGYGDYGYYYGRYREYYGEQ
jgi:polysaccharide biosynthesis transport protein